MNSMTGFGAASSTIEGGNLRVEISGVNRKQTEIAMSMPRSWTEFETALRALANAAVSRGRVQISVNWEPNAAASSTMSLNEVKMQALSEQLPIIKSQLGESVSISLDSLCRLGILSEEKKAETSKEEIWPSLEQMTIEALIAFTRMRGEEGEKLKAEFHERINTLRQYREQIIQLAPSVITRHRENMLRRLEESGLPLPADDDRIIKEIALFADRCDVSEEMSRLASHLDQFDCICARDEAVGRPLDFLCQEIFRELNTTGSKANDAQLAQLIVNAKTELEKIREQVQNAE